MRSVVRGVKGKEKSEAALKLSYFLEKVRFGLGDHYKGPIGEVPLKFPKHLMGLTAIERLNDARYFEKWVRIYLKKVMDRYTTGRMKF